MPSLSKSHWNPVGSPVESVPSNDTVSGASPVRGVVAVNSATGPGGGVTSAMSGRYSIWAVALDVRLSVWPPKTKARIGVIRWNLPRTTTVVVAPGDSGHEPGLHVTWMSDGLMAIIEPADSSWTRQTTRFVASLQGWPETYRSGVLAAWNAPSRAALFSVMLA